MNFRIKASLLLVAMLVAATTGSSIAQAKEKYFHSISATTVFETQTVTHVFQTRAGKVTCKVAKGQGANSSLTVMEITLSFWLEQCTAFGFINVPVHTSGCDWRLTSENTTSGSLKPARRELVCGLGKAVEITAPGCTTKIETQNLEGGVTLANGSSGGKKDITATYNISGIAYNECGTNYTDGIYTGTSTITATGSGGAAADIWYE